MEVISGIRVSRGIQIEVNDNGETITMNVDDQTFIDKFYGLIDTLESVEKEMQSQVVKNLGDREQLQLMIERTRPIMDEVDALFGDDSCKKIFGNIVPSPYLMADFFEQLEPIAKKHMDGRQKQIAKKYNRNRKGGNKYRTKEEIILDAMR